MKKQPEVTEATRKDFIQAFCDYYVEKPIEQITVKEIAKKAGYSRVTFYNYFKDVYDLLNCIEEEFILRTTKEICSNIEKDEVLDNFFLTFDRLVSENELYSRVLLNNPNNTQFEKRLKGNMIPILLKSFGIPEKDKKASYALEFYVSGVISAISQWMRSGKEMPIGEVAEIIKGILQNGLLSQLKQ